MDREETSSLVHIENADTKITITSKVQKIIKPLFHECLIKITV